MRIPRSLAPLLEQGLIQEVIRPLMSGKEAQVYLVISGDEERVAKVYKEAEERTFKHRVTYAEGRRTRNSRDLRAMRKHSRYGRAQDERAWRSTEVDMLYRLRDAGVRVPTPHHFIDGVLVMELVKGDDSCPAPRLGEVTLDRLQAESVFDTLLREVVKMLCAGVVHGDLSDYNVLLGRDGPVLIDLPQAVDASANQSARRILLRDVANLNGFVARYAPGRPRMRYGEEMWALYDGGELLPDTELTGRYRQARKKTDVAAFLEELDAVREEATRKRERSSAPPTEPRQRQRRPPVMEARQARPAPSRAIASPPGERPSTPRRRRRRRRRAPAEGSKTTRRPG